MQLKKTLFKGGAQAIAPLVAENLSPHPNMLPVTAEGGETDLSNKPLKLFSHS